MELYTDPIIIKESSVDKDCKLVNIKKYKYCRNCGNKLPKESNFCDECGNDTRY